MRFPRPQNYNPNYNNQGPLSYNNQGPPNYNNQGGPPRRPPLIATRPILNDNRFPPPSNDNRFPSNDHRFPRPPAGAIRPQRNRFDFPSSRFNAPRNQFFPPRNTFDSTRSRFEQPNVQFENPRIRFDFSGRGVAPPRNQFVPPMNRFNNPSSRFDSPMSRGPPPIRMAPMESALHNNPFDMHQISSKDNDFQEDLFNNDVPDGSRRISTEDIVEYIDEISMETIDTEDIIETNETPVFSKINKKPRLFQDIKSSSNIHDNNLSNDPRLNKKTIIPPTNINTVDSNNQVNFQSKAPTNNQQKCIFTTYLKGANYKANQVAPKPPIDKIIPNFKNNSTVVKDLPSSAIDVAPEVPRPRKRKSNVLTSNSDPLTTDFITNPISLNNENETLGYSNDHCELSSELSNEVVHNEVDNDADLELFSEYDDGLGQIEPDLEFFSETLCTDDVNSNEVASSSADFDAPIVGSLANEFDDIINTIVDEPKVGKMEESDDSKQVNVPVDQPIVVKTLKKVIQADSVPKNIKPNSPNPAQSQISPKILKESVSDSSLKQKSRPIKLKRNNDLSRSPVSISRIASSENLTPIKSKSVNTVEKPSSHIDKNIGGGNKNVLDSGSQIITEDTVKLGEHISSQKKNGSYETGSLDDPKLINEQNEQNVFMASGDKSSFVMDSDSSYDAESYLNMVYNDLKQSIPLSLANIQPPLNKIHIMKIFSICGKVISYKTVLDKSSESGM